jgi:glucan biosynthesis protein C
LKIAVVISAEVGMRASGASLALNNLRAVVILLVLAVHSVLAYLDFLPRSPYRFDEPPYRWQATPIVDSQRWVGFDLFCAWQDVYLMSFMFFLSGLFVWPSLVRKGSWGFLRDRFLRIGLPLVLAVIFLMPIALYPVYRLTAIDPSPAAYWQHWRELPFWPPGPQWFLCVLLAFNVIAAGLYKLAPQCGDLLGSLASSARAHPIHYFIVLTIASALVYVPLALIFSPWSWIYFGPFNFQLSRPLHYLVYFFAGVGVGVYGLDRGLLALDGNLARRWGPWLVAAFISFLLWISLTALNMNDGDRAPIGMQLANDLAFVLACASSCFFFVALFLRFGQHRSRWYDSLSENAYGIYLVHYLFVVWLQYALLNVALFAFAKAAIVFGITLVMSWSVSAAIRGFPWGSRLIGAKR